jgi:monomeric sarcosine oxidase
MTYDAIVLGTGAIGSAALWRLAVRGHRVLGLDQFSPPHDQGSAHGQTRMIRQAYFEHPDYVPLVLEGYRLWRELEQVLGTSLYRETGVLQAGPPDGTVVRGVLTTAAEHDLPVEVLSPAEVQQRWPGFRLSEELVGVFEQRAGYLDVEGCVSGCLEAARRSGAETRSGVVVHGWTSGADVVVHTSQGDFRTAKLVVAAGPWAASLLHDAGLSLQVLRKVMCWFGADAAELRESAGFPSFVFDLPEGVFYGFPAFDDAGLKAAQHTGGQPYAAPDQVDRTVHASDWEPVERVLRAHIPAAGGRRAAKTCLYTMSCDGHFLVDRLAADPRIAFAAGLSGHGFKFATVLGEALADLAIEGSSRLPIGFLQAAGRG